MGCISEKRHQISDKKDHFARWSFLLYINCINSFTVHSVIGRLVPLFNGLVPILARPDDTSSRSLAFRPLHHG